MLCPHTGCEEVAVPNPRVTKAPRIVSETSQGLRIGAGLAELLGLDGIRRVQDGKGFRVWKIVKRIGAGWAGQNPLGVTGNGQARLRAHWDEALPVLRHPIVCGIQDSPFGSHIVASGLKFLDQFM